MKNFNVLTKKYNYTEGVTHKRYITIQVVVLNGKEYEIKRETKTANLTGGFGQTVAQEFSFDSLDEESYYNTTFYYGMPPKPEVVPANQREWKEILSETIALMEAKIPYNAILAKKEVQDWSYILDSLLAEWNFN